MTMFTNWAMKIVSSPLLAFVRFNTWLEWGAYRLLGRPEWLNPQSASSLERFANGGPRTYPWEWLLAHKLLTGDGVAPDPERAVALLRPMAYHGFGPAMSSLAGAYHYGLGVDVDLVSAVRWHRAAAEADGDTSDLCALAYFADQGLGMARDPIAAAAWERRACASLRPDDAAGMTKYGRLCMLGTGKPADMAEAVGWWQRAAALGNETAAVYLGIACIHGDGIPVDEAAARRWLRPGARADRAEAMCALGWLYAEGRGGRRSYRQARRLYRRGAALGCPTAMFNLGDFHEEGTGLPQDDARAVAWYRQAADLGYVDAKRRLLALQDAGRWQPVDPDSLAAADRWRSEVAAANADAATAATDSTAAEA